MLVNLSQDVKNKNKKTQRAVESMKNKYIACIMLSAQNLEM